MADNLQIGIKINADAGNASAQVNELTATLNRMSAGAAQSSRDVEKLSTASKAFSAAASAATTALAGFGAVATSRAILETATSIDRMRGMMLAASGTATQAASNMTFVASEARRMGLNLTDAADAFSRLTAASQGTALEGKAARDIFSAVAQATAALGMSAEDTSGVLNAIGQMMSKGKVQAEELRGQLGDRLPGAYNLAAKAMSMTTAEFTKQLEAGNVMASDFLPRFAKALDDTYSSARFDRVQNEINRLSTAWLEFKSSLIDPGTVANFISGLTDRVQNLGDALRGLKTVMQEMRGIQNSALTDPETVRLMRYGQGQASIDEIARVGRPEPAGTISAPASQSALFSLGDIQKMVYQEAIKQKFDAAFALAIAEQESRFNPNARSPVGAQGVMQLMPGTAKQLGVEIGDLADNIKGGVTYLKQQFDSFHSLKLTAAAYNAGPGAVTKYGGVPPYRETQGYVMQVGERYQKYKQMLGDSGGQMFGSAEDLKKEADTYYRIAADTIDRTLKLQDAQSATEKARRLAQVDQIREAADRAEKASTITIKTALDQSGIEAGMKAIDAAEKKQADYLRQANAAASGNAEVQAAQREIAAIDAKIKKAREYGQDESDLLNQRAIAEEGLKQSQIKAGQDNLTLQKSLAENHAKYDALRKSANEDELKFQDARKAYETQVNQATADGQKQAIDAALQRYQLALSAREVERQQLLANKSGAAYAEQQMANEQASRQDQINLIDAERQATQQKLAIDQQVLQIQSDALQKQIAETTDRERQLDLSRQLAQVNAGIAANAGQQQAAGYSAAGKIGQIYSDVAAKNDQRNIQQVEEAQLRLNQAMQESVQQAQLAAQHMTDAFGATGASIGQLVTSVAQFGQQMMQVNRDAASAIEQMRKNGSYSPEKAYEVQDAAAKKSIQYQVSLFGTLTQAASGFFGHASKGYTALQTAAKVFRAVEMGLAVQSAVLQIGQSVAAMMADKAQTVVAVANSEARAQAKGAEAVLNQGAGGDPVSAVPRMIAMGAMVATILGGIGMAVAGAVGGGGGVTPPNPADIQKAAGMGTVLGDASAQSQSISESLKLLTDNSTADLSYSADMLAALQSIDAGMKGLSVSIYGGIKSPTLSAKQIKSGKSIVDFGIVGDDQTVASLLSKGLSGQVYNDLQKMSTGGLMGGGSTVQWVKEFTGALPKNISDQFGRVMQSVVSSLGTAAGGLGLDGSLSKALGSTKVNVGRISLQGLSASQINDEISAVVGSIGDMLARKTIPGLKDFQKAGEGYYQTVVRVVQGTQEAGGELDQLGLRAISFRDILNKQGDVSAEIVRQTVLAQEGLGAGARAYVAQLNESSKDLIGTVKTIRETVAALRTGGFAADFSQAEVNAAGGLSALLSSLNDFNSKFLPASDQTAGKWRSMADSFTRLGLKMPTTNVGFMDLVRGIDQSTIAGQKLFGQVISLSSAFYDMTDAMGAATKDVQTAYDRQKALALSLADYVRTLGATDASASPSTKYAATKSTFEQALAAAKSGDETAQKNLQSVAQAYLDASRAYNGSTAAYAQDVQVVSAGLGGVTQTIEDQVSVAERQVSALDVNSGAVLSLADAINRYLQQASTAGAIASGQQAGTASVAEVNAGNNTAAAADAAYKASAAYKQQRQDAADKFTHDINWWLIQASKANSAAALNRDISTANSLIQQAYNSPFNLAVSQIKGNSTGRVSDDRYTVSLRAKGGYTPAGYVLAGEHGPELMRFDRPSQVMTADETRQILQGGDPKALGQLAESVRASITDIGKAGIKVDQAGYQELIKLLSSIDARMAAVESSRKLAGAA